MMPADSAPQLLDIRAFLARRAERRARRRANSAAATWGPNALRSIASLTRRTVSGRTPARLWRTRSTVARLTPAWRAMSLSVRVVFASRFSIL